MKNIFLLLFSFTIFSCIKSDIKQFESGVDPTIDASGRQYDFLEAPLITYCGPGWGRKFCRFLAKYEGTIWEDSENYHSDFSDIKFSNFNNNRYFISFFNLDSATSFCEGWKLGETNYNGKKWKIEIKKDQEDVFWFDYDYYGSSNEIEYSITYKYEVIDGLLNFSSTDGKTFIYKPSQKNYSKDAVNTGEIIELDGCLFY